MSLDLHDQGMDSLFLVFEV